MSYINFLEFNFLKFKTILNTEKEKERSRNIFHKLHNKYLRNISLNINAYFFIYVLLFLYVLMFLQL